MVLTVLAHDKAGQVERIANCVAEHHGNWLESRMARMAGQFAGILRVEVPAAHRPALVRALERLGEQGIRVLVEQSTVPQGEAWKLVTLTLTANDRPGIVRDLSRLLAGKGVNVERLSTDVSPAPMFSELLFRAEAQLAVPEALSLEALQETLESMADELMVDLELRPEP
nr:ACT domain-containing protein [Pseudomonas sp. RIT-PI-S]